MAAVISDVMSPSPIWVQELKSAMPLNPDLLFTSNATWPHQKYHTFRTNMEDCILCANMAHVLLIGGLFFKYVNFASPDLYSMY
jgi:hypothetical protein